MVKNGKDIFAKEKPGGRPYSTRYQDLLTGF